MKKRMNSRLIFIALFSIFASVLLLTGVFYAQLKTQVFSDLKIFAEVLIDKGDLRAHPSELRITLIEPDGTVSYDSSVSTTLQNHLDRPEVIKAIETGEGYGTRRSDTLAKNVFYYARKLDDGSIVRIGKEAKSVYSVMLNSVPMVCVLAILLIGICLALSSWMTKDMVKPIEQMAEHLDDIQEDESYPELIPFARKIRTQHEEIMNNANMRQEFTANVSHELKTPLAAISGYTELLEAGMVNEEDKKHFLQEIRKSSDRLLTLTNDILNLSKLDAGIGISDEEVDLASIARESVTMLEVHASEHNVSMHYEGDESASLKIGKEMAQELVYNLIENAIRYNRPNGKVTVSVLKQNDYIKLSVSDTGIGIEPDQQERIFERFYRVDKSRSKALGGTGLGLAIVKHICAITDGEIELLSEKDVGTKITITWKA
mgnify:FL=1